VFVNRHKLPRVLSLRLRSSQSVTISLRLLKKYT
jgi:hypothetical protein